ncbi:MAG: PaaI family thioesterase [Hyphomicrobiales bacterium]|nr:PaaI family thioesterase [Hyphomicrobiales bacterium]
MTQTTFEFVQDNIAQTPFHQWLLPELREVDEQAGQVTIRLPIRPEFCRLPGRPELHGAIVAAMVDISGHAAIAAKVLHSVATIDMRVDYLRLASGKELVAVATVVKIGRTIGVVDIRITDDQKRLVAIGRAAYVTANV